LYIGARFYYREGPKKPEEMDFITNIEEIEADTYVASKLTTHLDPNSFIFSSDMMNRLPETKQKLSGNGW
jgi:hypothetical protein